ncbi:hypothetical protein AgCh_004394 [Apium graveolens]
MMAKNPDEESNLIFVGAMIKVFKVKEKQREVAENSNGKPPVKKQSAGELRLHKDISELNLPRTCRMSFPIGKDDLMNFEVIIRPDEGYRFGVKCGATYRFTTICLDPSRKFDLDPSRILGQPLNPSRRISTRIHDLDFDQDPSRTFDLDLGRKFVLVLIPGRKVSTRIHDLDFDQDPSRTFDLDLGQKFVLVLIPGHDLDFDQDPSRTFDLDLAFAELVLMDSLVFAELVLIGRLIFQEFSRNFIRVPPENL